VRRWAGNNQGFEIQCGEAWIHKKDEAAVFREKLLRRFDKHGVKLLALSAARPSGIAKIVDGFAIRSGEGLQIRSLGNFETLRFDGGDGPKIGMILPNPVKKKSSLQTLGELLRLHYGNRSRR